MTTQSFDARRTQARQEMMAEVRKSEEQVLDSLQLPGAMNTALDRRAGELAAAVSTGTFEEAQAAASRLGLRNDDIVRLLRDSDESTRLAYCRLVMDPQRLNEEMPVIGSLSYKNAEDQRAFAERFAAEGDRAKWKRCSDQVLKCEARGREWQTKLYQQLLAQGPEADYKTFMREMGFKRDVFAIALRSHDRAAADALTEDARATIAHMNAHQAEWKRQEALESSAGAIRLADARWRNGIEISDDVKQNIILARQGHPDAPEAYRMAIPERDLSQTPVESRTVSTTILSAEQYTADIRRLESGRQPSTDSYSFLDRAYINASPDERERFVPESSDGVPAMNGTAEAGLRILVERYRSRGNQAAVDALETLVKWPSSILTSAEREELFRPPTQYAVPTTPTERQQRQESPPQEQPAAPEESADPFAALVTKLQHWDRCLHRFLEGNTGLPPEARETAAAYRLTARYSAADLLNLERAAAGNPELVRLSRVLNKARTFLENRTLTA